MSLEPYRRKDGLISYSVKFWFHGRCYRRGLGPIPLKAARMAERKARVEAANGTFDATGAPPGPTPLPTFDTFADRFLAWYATDARPGSVRTVTSRLNSHILPYFGTRRLSEATTALLDAYRTIRRQEGAAPASLNGELSTLSAMLRKAVEWDLMPASAKGRITWLRVEDKPIRVLSLDEERRLLLAATPRLTPVIAFALQTGLRRNELVSLTWADVDLARAEVTVTAHRAKNHRARVIPLNQTALAILKTAQSKHGRVFGYHSVAVVMDTAVKKAGLREVSMHTLRHTFASRAIEAGINIETLRRWLGHSKLNMTMRYLHPSEAHEREAIERLGGTGNQHRRSPGA